jgi:hypothetical protein
VRSRKLRWTLAGLVVPVAVVAFVLWPRPSRITLQNGNLIRLGMSRQEVLDILGPPGDYSTYDVDLIYPGPRPHVTLRGTFPDGRFAEWLSDSAVVFLSFHGERVTRMEVLEVQIIDHGPFGNLLWRVKRQWRKLFPE